MFQLSLDLSPIGCWSCSNNSKDIGISGVPTIEKVLLINKYVMVFPETSMQKCRKSFCAHFSCLHLSWGLAQWGQVLWDQAATQGLYQQVLATWSARHVALFGLVVTHRFAFHDHPTDSQMKWDTAGNNPPSSGMRQRKAGPPAVCFVAARHFYIPILAHSFDHDLLSASNRYFQRA